MNMCDFCEPILPLMKDSQKKTFGESLALTQQSIDFPSTFVGIEMHSNTDKFQREMHSTHEF